MKNTSPGERGRGQQPTPSRDQRGLANEPRPGLGSRAASGSKAAPPPARRGRKVKATTDGKVYQEPIPEPREQAPDSYAHEEERSTGVSGHSGGT